MSESQHTDSGDGVPHDDYTPVRHAVGTQQEVADWWARMEYPVHEDGVFRSGSGNFKGYQYDDGSGKLRHYSTIEAIRTRSGLLISNKACWSRGFAVCTTPSTNVVPIGQRTTLPLSSMKRKLPEGDIYDITEVVEGDIEDDDGYDRVVIIEVEGGEYAFRASRQSFNVEVLDKRGYDEFMEAIQA